MRLSIISAGRLKVALAVTHWMIAFGQIYIIHRERLLLILQKNFLLFKEH